MIRTIIQIDETKCNACGLCVNACHEGAIGLVNGKAKLLRDDYCDGMGDCLPTCPAGAISFIEREAAAYDEAAVRANLAKTKISLDEECAASELRNWPVQIKLTPVFAPCFVDCNLLIAADCTAFARANFHAEFMCDKLTLIGCPKLDAIDYAEKLAAIISENSIRSLTVVRMQVPCCGGIEMAVKRALAKAGKNLPLEVITLSTSGEIL